MKRNLTLACLLALACWTPARAQDAPRTVRAGRLTENIAIDGRLNEPAWSTAEPATGFLQVDPKEGGLPTGQTLVRVLTTAEALIIGIHCQDPAGACRHLAPRLTVTSNPVWMYRSAWGRTSSRRSP